MTRLLFDLSILRHPRTGTARYATELLTAMRLCQGLGDSIDTTDGLPRARRGHRVFRYANAAGDLLWLTAASRVVSRRRRSDVWYSPANVLPLGPFLPSVVTIHDVNFLIVPEAFDRMYRSWATTMFKRTAANADQILVDSAYTADQLAQFFDVPRQLLTVAYPGLDHVFRAVPGPREPHLPERYALFVGQTEPHKNVALLLEAWRSDVPEDLHLVIAGGAGRDDENLRALASSSELNQRVHFLGRVNEARLARLYSDARCFLFPSRVEGFGFPPLEAMARGVPTAVANLTSLPEVTGSGALWFDADDPSALAAIVREMAEDGLVRRRLQHDGPIKAAEYRWSATAGRAWDAVRQAQ